MLSYLPTLSTFVGSVPLAGRALQVLAQQVGTGGAESLTQITRGSRNSSAAISTQRRKEEKVALFLTHIFLHFHVFERESPWDVNIPLLAPRQSWDHLGSPGMFVAGQVLTFVSGPGAHVGNSITSLAGMCQGLPDSAQCSVGICWTCWTSLWGSAQTVGSPAAGW